jgi:hypothetical protein
VGEQVGFQRGRLVLADGFARREWLRGGGIALGVLAFSCILSVWANNRLRDLLRVERTWREGVASPVEAAYGGNVTTHNFMLKHYDLDVRFLTEAGEEREFKAEFYRFFTGPDEGEPMTVRYLAADPGVAVSSWEHEGATHGFWLFGCAVFLALLCLVGSGLIVKGTARTVARVSTIASEGRLMLVRVEETKIGGAQKRPILVVKYQTASGALEKQSFALHAGAPYFVEDGARVVAMGTLDDKEAYLLREDGYPLAERPALPEAT